jgi:AraC family cel operon transcriptional repressor
MGDEDALHIARVTIHSRDDLSQHNHDYAEIFWIESGKGLHIINGQQLPLGAGSLVMIRPDDEHTFTSNGHGLTIMNLAFPAETLAYFRNRYFLETNDYFWTPDSLPYATLLDKTQVRRLSQKAEETWKNKKSKFYLDALLLFIFNLTDTNKDLDLNPQIPAWLQKAAREYVTPEWFKQGIMGFATLCGKNADHINRVTRACYQQTLSEFITGLRMDFAARQLSMTNTPIKAICNDCGFGNLGHFYKTFKATFNQTPIAYREANQTIV